MSASHAPARRSAPGKHQEWEQTRAEAAGCRACPLWARGTQTVFGEGPVPARIMLIGEQPGDVEDQTGHVFVGPAGHLLDRALDEAGIDRGEAYVTNVVKHFKWEPRGKRRIHSKPSGAEVRACRAWLDREFELVDPGVVVLLGATAAKAVLGNEFRVTASRGTWTEAPGVQARMLATVHPSSVLRASDDAARHDAFAAFARDLSVAARGLEQRR